LFERRTVGHPRRARWERDLNNDVDNVILNIP
jgi:hypothetical protein